MAIAVAAAISGVVAILSALIFADASDFTKLNILLGNRVINTEITQMRALTRAEYMRMFWLSAMAWLFPLAAIVIGCGGLLFGASAAFLINLIYAAGILFVFVAGFLATYANRKRIKTQGALTTLIGVGASLSNVIAGWIVQYGGYSTGFLFLAAVAVLGAAVFGRKRCAGPTFRLGSGCGLMPGHERSI